MFFSIFLTTDDTVECMKGLSLRAAVVGNGEYFQQVGDLHRLLGEWGEGRIVLG